MKSVKSVDNPETAVLAAAKDMLRRGLVEGTAGNISARRSDGNIVITPSSVDYGDMQLDDLVLVDPDGAVLQAKDGRSPSSEMKLHLACYQAFDDIGSVIHSHPVWATMFAIAHEPIPACIDEFAVYCGGDVRCTDYAASGTPDVGANAVKALEGRGAALIANHGLVAVGPRPDKVLHITALVERTAQIVWGARALGGPVPIPEDVNRNFADGLRLPARQPDVMNAPYRVVQWSTGNIGRRALGVLLDRDDFDVVGVHAFGADKVGGDAGVLAGRPPVGVAATGDIDALIELRPDCVNYMPRVIDYELVTRMLRSGINVVTTGDFLTGTHHPVELPALEEAARRGARPSWAPDSSQVSSTSSPASSPAHARGSTASSSSKRWTAPPIPYRTCGRCSDSANRSVRR